LAANFRDVKNTTSRKDAKPVIETALAYPKGGKTGCVLKEGEKGGSGCWYWEKAHADRGFVGRITDLD